MKEKGKKEEEEEKRILSGHDAFVQHATPTLGCRARPSLWVHLNTQRNYANNTPSIFEFNFTQSVFFLPHLAKGKTCVLKSCRTVDALTYNGRIAIFETIHSLGIRFGPHHLGW